MMLVCSMKIVDNNLFRAQVNLTIICDIEKVGNRPVLNHTIGSCDPILVGSDSLGFQAGSVHPWRFPLFLNGFPSE